MHFFLHSGDFICGNYYYFGFLYSFYALLFSGITGFEQKINCLISIRL
jgi:hypothetical protein